MTSLKVIYSQYLQNCGSWVSTAAVCSPFSINMSNISVIKVKQCVPFGSERCQDLAWKGNLEPRGAGGWGCGGGKGRHVYHQGHSGHRAQAFFAFLVEMWPNPASLGVSISQHIYRKAELC